MTKRANRLFPIFYLAAILAVGALVASCTTPNTNGNPLSPTDTPVISFSISPSSGAAGTTVVLTWTATPSDTRIAITASAGVNPGTAFPTTGATTVTPIVTTTYTITGTDPRTGVQTNVTQIFTVK